MDETWGHHSEPETKEQSETWKHVGSRVLRIEIISKRTCFYFLGKVWDTSYNRAKQ